MRTAVIALVLAACGGSSKSSTMAKAGPSCGDVANAMVGMMAEGKESTKAFVDAKEDFVTIISTRCTQDAWTAEAKQCLATMKSREDGDGEPERLEPAAENRHGERWVIDVRVAGDEHDVAAIPAELVHLGAGGR